MGWIFIQCSSQYQGECIRSYIAFGSAIVVCLLSLVACIMYYKQMKYLSFQQLPLSINFLTSLSLIAIYSQNQMFNIRLILLLIEIYSYFLLSFGFIFNVLRKSFKQNTRKRQIWAIFGVVTSITGILIILLIVFTAIDTMNCSWDQQVGSILVLALEIPLAIMTFFYISKAKVALASAFHTTSQQVQGDLNNTGLSEVTYHLLTGDDYNKRLNYKQVNIVRFAFITSLVLHTVQLVSVYLNNHNDEIFCNPETNRLTITGALGLYTVSIESISQLFPHIIIPIIFWYLTARPKFRAQTLYFTKNSEHKTKETNKNNQIQQSNLSNLNEEVRIEENLRDKISRKRFNSHQQS